MNDSEKPRPIDAHPIHAAFAAVTDAWVGLVGELGADDWSRPALGVWDVRALVGHTLRAYLTIDRLLAEGGVGALPEIDTSPGYYRAVLAKPDIHEDVAVRGVEAGESLGDDPVATVQRTTGATMATLANADADLVGPTAVGTMRLVDYLPTRLVEVSVHLADLSAAVDRPLPELDGVWERVLGLVAATATGERARAAALALLGRGGLSEGFNLFG